MLAELRVSVYLLQITQFPVNIPPVHSGMANHAKADDDMHGSLQDIPTQSLNMTPSQCKSYQMKNMQSTNEQDRKRPCVGCVQ
jgi:hypothetical protein